MTEHRLEDVFPMSNRVLVMDEGRIICDGTPAETGESLRGCGHGMFLAMPTPMRVYAAVPNDWGCPVTVRDGRLWLDNFAQTHTLGQIPREMQKKPPRTAAIEMDDVWFKYEKDGPDVLRGLSFTAYPGELLAILGGNGTGKTTTLSVISGINKPYRGEVLIEGRVPENSNGLFDGLLGALPQNPQSLFVKKTVREDLREILKDRKLSPELKDRRLAYVVRLCRLEELLERHPYDLSGGEQQRAALAKVLLIDPKILLLDEPTKGLDAEFKRIFAEILKSLLRRSVAVVMVSHDIEFCAKYADRCALFFDGGIVTESEPHAFFSGNSFYTTAASRMARHLLPEAVTAEDVIAACGGTVPPPPELGVDDGPLPEPETPPPVETLEKLPLWRKILSGVAGAVLIGLGYIALTEPDIPWLMEKNKTGLYIVLLAVAGILSALLNRRGEKPIENEQVPVGQRKMPKRTVAAAAMILLAIPLTIFIGVFWLDDRKYYFISILVIFETMLPFFLLFERRKPQARELMVIAVLCALNVAGRAAFFMLPQFKPVMALVIVSGVAFGGESGFLVGAVTMLASNILFGQGPWTPWQMFAMGLIGFLAGVLFRKGVLRRSRLPLCIFGGLAAVVIYGGIMNPCIVFIYNDHPMWPMFLSAYILGFPFDLVQAAATVFFLWIFSRPMLEKLDRIKVKYGLVETRTKESPGIKQECYDQGNSSCLELSNKQH
jgi:energy-coupling factor transport system ATP-binding protein